MARQTSPNPTLVPPSDRPLLDTPAGRDNDHGIIDSNALNAEELRERDIRTRPASDVTGRHDDGSGANETDDGLDELQEEVRLMAEDVPEGEDLQRGPVFDAGEGPPKV